ncbi:MAG: hypothetical protein JST79_01535 [Acidobacteria bacterium]|nr:hypothetical protein [Acidobacteriota bacterium]
MSSNIGTLESALKTLTNWNLGLLVFAGLAALAIGVLSILIDRASTKLLEAKEEQTKLRIASVESASQEAISLAKQESDEKIATLNAQLASANMRSLELRKELERSIAVSSAKQSELEKEQQKTAEAQKSAAEAQLKLDQWLARKVIARTAEASAFQVLKKFPKANIEVLYKEGDGEAFMYAQSILQAFKSIGWNVPTVAVATNKHPMAGNESIPIMGTYVVTRVGETEADKGGVFLPSAPPADFDPSSRTIAVMSAVGAQTRQIDGSVPENTFRIVVGEYLKWWIP